MAWYGVGSAKKPVKKDKDVEYLLQKAIENFKRFLADPRKNRNKMMADLDNIKVERRPYTRKTDGKKSHLLVAKIKVKVNGNTEVREYTFNRGYFQRI